MPNFLTRAGDAVKSVPDWFRHMNRNRALITAGVAVAIVGISVGLVVSGASKPVAARGRRVVATTTTVPPKVVTARCPLTDTPPASGVVPRRPALLIKIGNEPEGARPQSGLNEADIVFDTPAEGFIMRYVAVYQCRDANEVGPNRSVRWVDWNMVARQFVRPILAFAGGINQNVDGVASKPWISEANLLEGAQDAAHRTDNREPPDNLFSSTTLLYAMFKNQTTPPPPIFNYGAKLPPGATPAASLGINFSGGTDVVWNWDAKSHTWLHTYSGTPDIDTLTGQQVSTTNIVVVIASYAIGPYIESTGGTGDVESQLTGSGSGYVLRNGTSTKVTWHRPDQLGKTTFTNSAGQPVNLTPGRTWVEIVPDVQADAPGGIHITP